MLFDAVDGFGVALDEGERDHGDDEEGADDDVVSHQFPRLGPVARYEEAGQEETGRHENDADST